MISFTILLVCIFALIYLEIKDYKRTEKKRAEVRALVEEYKMNPQWKRMGSSAVMNFSGAGQPPKKIKYVDNNEGKDLIIDRQAKVEGSPNSVTCTCGEVCGSLSMVFDYNTEPPIVTRMFTCYKCVRVTL